MHGWRNNPFHASVDGILVLHYFSIARVSGHRGAQQGALRGKRTALQPNGTRRARPPSVRSERLIVVGWFSCLSEVIAARVFVAPLDFGSLPPPPSATAPTPMTAVAGAAPTPVTAVASASPPPMAAAASPPPMPSPLDRRDVIRRGRKVTDGGAVHGCSRRS